MKRLNVIIALLIISVIWSELNAQTTTIDSLENLLLQHKNIDTIRVNLLNETASNYLNANNREEALEYAEKAIKLAEELSYSNGKAKSFNLIAKYHFNKSDYAEALANYKESLIIYKELGEKKQISQSFHKIGLVYRFQGNYPKAIEYYQKSLKINQELGYRIGIAKSLNNIGVVYKIQGDYLKALEYYQKSLKIKQELGYRKGISGSLNNIGVVYKIQGDYLKALEYYHKALKITKELGDKKGISGCLNNIGVIYYNQANYPKALEYYQKSLKIKEDLEDIKSISSTLNNIGEVFKSQGDYDKALEYYQKSLKISEEHGDKINISSTLSNIGEVFKSQGDYDKVLEYYQKSLKINEKLGDKKGISNCLKLIGRIYFEQGNDLLALEYLQKSLKISDDIGDMQGACVSYYYAGTVYLKTNNFTKALDFTNRSLKIAKELELLNNQKDIYKQLSEIYATTKKYKKAFENHVLYKELKDSIFNEKNIKKITRLEYQYKYEKEKQTIELEQQKKDAVTSKEIKHQKTIRNVFIAGLFIALFIIFLFYRIVRIKKKANNILRAKNKEIIQQKDLISEQKSEIQTQADELLEHKTNLEAIVEQRTAAFIKAKEQAEESDQLKTAFLNNISHEFRTPMNGILGFSTLLINSNSPEKQNEFADIVNKSCRQLLNIVNDTVEISKVHSAQAKVIKSTVNVSSIISEIINEFQDSAFQKGIDISLELKLEKEQMLIEIDENKIERIFWHLLDNAVKFTYSGHIKIIGQEIGNNIIQFQIEDTGIGISPELQEKIFDPFRQAETGATRSFGGNGIGLSLVKAYIEILGGKIWLESEIEKGTTVFFTIPVIESVNKEAEKQIVITCNINDKTILIAEDNDMNFVLIREILFNYNIKLLHAWNGKEALVLFKKEKHIDLILMDLKMPVMDGYEALKQIRSINPKIPVIAQTAYASDTDKEEIMSAGFNDYITKPINEYKLVQMLKLRI